MSKSVITCIMISAAIAIILVAGVFTSVQGAKLNAGVKNGQAHAGLYSPRHSLESVAPFYSEGRGGHHCDSESDNPLDD